MPNSGSKNHLKKHAEKDHRPEFDYGNPYNDYPRAEPYSVLTFIDLAPRKGDATVCKNCDDTIYWDGTEWLHQFDMIANCAPMVE